MSYKLLCLVVNAKLVGHERVVLLGKKNTR